MEKADYIRFPHSPQKTVIHQITYHGFSFILKTDEQVERMKQMLAVMTYAQVAKLHKEIYGATLPKKQGGGR